MLSNVGFHGETSGFLLRPHRLKQPGKQDFNVGSAVGLAAAAVPRGAAAHPKTKPRA